MDIRERHLKRIEVLGADLSPVSLGDEIETALANATPTDVMTEDELVRAPVWPAGIAPAVARAYANAQARAIDVPPEMVFVPLLVFAGGTIGNAVELELKAGWTVSGSLWAGLISPPGKKKTPTLKAAQWPLNILQKRLYDQWNADLASHEAEVQAWEAQLKAERGPKPRPPAMDHLYTTDVTLEALVGMLSRSPGVSIIRDELVGFVASFDKYRGGKGSDRQEYLSLWAGAPVKADRKGGGSVFATHPVGSVYGGIQPDFASQLHTRSGSRDGWWSGSSCFGLTCHAPSGRTTPWNRLSWTPWWNCSPRYGPFASGLSTQQGATPGGSR